MFEAFCSDAIPLLLLPQQMIDSIYRSSGASTRGRQGVADHIQDVIHRPQPYWEAVLKTRAHLADHHSFQRRFQELSAILQAVVRQFRTSNLPRLNGFARGWLSTSPLRRSFNGT